MKIENSKVIDIPLWGAGYKSGKQEGEDLKHAKIYYFIKKKAYALSSRVHACACRFFCSPSPLFCRSLFGTRSPRQRSEGYRTLQI